MVPSSSTVLPAAAASARSSSAASKSSSTGGIAAFWVLRSTLMPDPWPPAAAQWSSTCHLRHGHMRSDGRWRRQPGCAPPGSGSAWSLPEAHKHDARGLVPPERPSREEALKIRREGVSLRRRPPGTANITQEKGTNEATTWRTGALPALLAAGSTALHAALRCRRQRPK